MTKKHSPKFTIHVKANVCYSAEIEADSFEEALAKARELKHDGLWEAPGDIIDTEYKIEGVFKS